MKKSLFSIVLLSSLSMATAYGAASAAQDQKAQADAKSALSTIRSLSDSTPTVLEPADVKAAAAAVQVASPKPKLSEHPVVIQIAEAAPGMLRDLCAIMYEYSKPSPLIFTNELPENTRMDGDNLSRYDFMRIRFMGLEKTLYPGQELDVAPELESWQIIPVTIGVAVSTQKLHLGYVDPGTRRITAKKYGVLANEELLWKGKRFCLTKAGAFIEQFVDLDPVQEPELEAKPEPAAKPDRPKVQIPARVLQSARKLNFG